MKTISLITILLSTTILLSAQSKNELKSPNVIIILADDLGYADVGFNGCLDIPTPQIDKIAERGAHFTNGYVSYCVCGPSRAGLITGRYQDRFGFSRNPLFAPNDSLMGLPLSEETLADALKQANYKSLAIGKWHLGAHESLHPLKRGFDDFFGFLSGGHQYFPELWTLNDPYEAKSQFDGYKTKLLKNYSRIDEKEYLTDALSREAVSYIEKNKDNPFFIYLAYNAPHTPLQATKKYLSRFNSIKEKKRKTYAAMISAVDDGVGSILSKLEELNLTENTIVIFLSDNGGPEKKNGSDNGVLRGGKSDVFEGGIRVPFAMMWPAKIEAGTVYEKPVISLDIFASVIAQTKNHVKTKNPIDGVDLLPYLTGNKKGNPHDFLFWRKFDAKDIAVRKGDKKLVLQNKGSEMLINLKNDISEQINLSDRNPELAKELKSEMEKWETKMVFPVFMGLQADKIYSEQHPNRFIKPIK